MNFANNYNQNPSQDMMRQASFNPNLCKYRYPFICQDEEFRQISTYLPEFRDYFWVSNYGKVYNAYSGYLVAIRYNEAGYQSVSIRRKSDVSGDDGSPSIGVHILVCTAFIGPKPGPYYHVNHKNFIRDDNYYKNLEWVTPQENLEYSRAAGHYWNEDGSYKANVYGTETVRKLCELLQSGITDPQQLSKIVFNKEPTPGIYSLIRQIKSGKNWGNISRDYTIPDVEHRNFTDDSMIHNICRYLQDHPDRVHGPNSIGAIELAQYIGVNRETMTEKEWRRYISALNQIRNKKAYARIVSQYKF